MKLDSPEWIQELERKSKQDLAKGIQNRLFVRTLCLLTSLGHHSVKELLALQLEKLAIC